MNTGIKRILLISTAYFACSQASADTFQWSTQNATYGLLQGSVTFTTSPDSKTSDCGASTCYLLTIAVSNTSSNPATQSSDVLDGIFFDIELASNGSEVSNATGMASAQATGGQLNSTGYTITSGTKGANICGAGTAASAQGPTCTTVANGWEDAYSTSGFTVGGTAYKQQYGIGDAGWGLFNGNDVGNPINGIVPGGNVGIASTASKGFTKDFPLVYGTATFVLYGLTTDKIKFANVVADYGTQPEANAGAQQYYIQGPEPSAVVMTLAGAALLMMLQKRRRP